MPVTQLQFTQAKHRIDTATGADLDAVGMSYGIKRLAGDRVKEGDIGYRTRIIAQAMETFNIEPVRYEPVAGDHFIHSDSDPFTGRCFRAISVGERMIFAEDIQEGEETICDKFGSWVKVAQDGEPIRYSRIRNIFCQVIDHELPRQVGANKIMSLVKELEQQAEERAQREAQPTPEQAIAIGHRVHLAIENSMDSIMRPHGMLLSEWHVLRGTFIKAAQDAFNEFEEKEQANDCPF